MSPSFRYRQIALIGSFSSRDCERPSILVAVDLWTGTIGHIRHFGQISLNPNFLLTPRHSRSPPVYNWRWLGNISQIARISHHDKLHLSGCCLTVTLMELWEYLRSVKDWRGLKVFTWNSCMWGPAPAGVSRLLQPDRQTSSRPRGWTGHFNLMGL